MTTRIDGRKNDTLLSDLGGNSFPWVVFLDAEGQLIGKAGDRSPKGLEATAGKVKTYLELKKKADGGDASGNVELALLQGEVGVLDFDEIEEAIEGAELTADQKKRVGALRADAAVAEFVAMSRAARGNQEAGQAAFNAAKEDFLALYKDGNVPASLNSRWTFFRILFDVAVEKKDLELMGASLEVFREVLKDSTNPRAKTFLEEKEKQLADMKAEQDQEAKEK